MPRKTVNSYPATRPWSTGALKALHRGSAKCTPVKALAQMLKRTEGAIRQKARAEGLPVGKKQRGVATAGVRAGKAKALGL